MITWPRLEDVDAASEFILRHWYLSLPRPATDEQIVILERVAVRCEGCGIVTREGGLL